MASSGDVDEPSAARDGELPAGEATVVESTLTDPDVGTCVAKTMLRWKFPASPPGAGPVKIRYPFVLEPG